MRFDLASVRLVRYLAQFSQIIFNLLTTEDLSQRVKTAEVFVNKLRFPFIAAGGKLNGLANPPR